MATRRSLLDPFGLIAELGAQIEKAGNRAGNERMRTSEFSAAMNRALTVSLGAKKLSGDALRRLQLLFNVASHEDIVAVQDKLAAIDEKLLAITQVLARLDPQAAPASEQARPRTRKPPPEVVEVAPAPPPVPPEPPAAPAAKRARGARKKAS